MSAWVSNDRTGERYLIPDWLIDRMRTQNPALLDGYTVTPVDPEVPR